MKRILPEENMSWQRPVLSISNNGTASKGNRYIVGDSPTGEFSGLSTDVIAWHDGADWQIDVPEYGWVVYDANQNEFLVYLNDASGDYWYYWSDFFGGSGGGSTNWGDIGGTLSAQTDLQAELDAKLNLTGGTLTGSSVAGTKIFAVENDNGKTVMRIINGYDPSNIMCWNGHTSGWLVIGADYYNGTNKQSRLDLIGTNIFMTGTIWPSGDINFGRTGDASSTATQKNSYSAGFQASLWNGSAKVDRVSTIFSKVSTSEQGISLLTFKVVDVGGTGYEVLFIRNDNQVVSIGTTDLDGTPAVGKLTVKGSTNDGSTNIFVGRDSDEANVITIDTNGVITPGGYKSSDGTAGATGSFLDQGGNTVTVKDGLITAFS